LSLEEWSVLLFPLALAWRFLQSAFVGTCLENMSLQAAALGLGCLWICDIYFAYDALTEWLGAQGSLAAAFALGYPAENPPPRPRKPLDELVEWRG